MLARVRDCVPFFSPVRDRTVLGEGGERGMGNGEWKKPISSISVKKRLAKRYTSSVARAAQSAISSEGKLVKCDL